MIEELLQQGAQEMGIELNEAQRTKLLQYLQLIIKWNKTYNLSAIRDLEEGVKKHLLDSLSVVSYINSGNLLDVGAGAGLPGIVISIMKPELLVTVLDTVGKKCRFMQFAKTQLALKNLTVINQRVEDYRPEQCFSQITSRAFSEVDKTLKLTRHLLCDNGHYLLMKGNHFASESLENYEMKVHQITVPYVSDQRHFLEIKPS
ncbi:16S rRNA (guanine(527)-N(7))-methyltransferase (EC 2.1.1.170) [uncultured Gammaproteobacteria bacterium]|uniref:16S rRNA (guanine(527)-N(7))-methyltransferase RsmG n=1 Tax=Bathymodiolus heckerae thiotrophic gill symbiont TaxID=1052212 RepID=UPI0010B0AA11|nr:16S rRNA (guanine(527)-N(7))-methyltransferase RsmG [Bathymodiolus heckerae thiotrophic gill symbiont]CAC9524793.1 16S rRNA (guanine(527)-N(7))-methyltransferase (EC 2.1.1.170) [uncultured Gammaproteobacteria bacterium]CAC9607959.1 16S rRNA (guanine(527)-N(7))-methyltransferase (EC 2.1.1.170) [uncultured Gammaproteobacteria bacterium]SHN92161.1 rRNA small subunit 7-methylguanosine (m7G) methyltransferase GidB [Bathymodiolus heckerae thiotrophic gill symbiont]